MSTPSSLTARSFRPAQFDAMQTIVEQAELAVPGQLLALCGARIRMLLGLPIEGDDPRFAELASYSSSPLFDDTERLALEFTEQYVLDVASTPSELVEELQRRLGAEGLYGFVIGLYGIDQSLRLSISATIHPSVGAYE